MLIKMSTLILKNRTRKFDMDLLSNGLLNLSSQKEGFFLKRKTYFCKLSPKQKKKKWKRQRVRSSKHPLNKRFFVPMGKVRKGEDERVSSFYPKKGKLPPLYGRVRNNNHFGRLIHTLQTSQLQF